MSEFTPEEKRWLEAWRAPDVPDGFLDRVVIARAAEVRTEAVPEVAPGPRRRRPWAFLAVAVALLAVVASLLVGVEPAPERARAPVAPVVLPPTHPAVQAAWVTVETARLEAQDAPTLPPVEPPVVEEKPPDEIPPMILGQ